MSSAPDLPPRERALGRRPEAVALSVERIVQDVLDGRIRVPGWQRPLKWRPSDGLRLLDSLYRGYPIATLLFWKRSAAPERVRFGTVSVDAPGRADALFVVDGQQRISTLVRALAGGVDDDFAAVFEPTDGAFAPARRGHGVPLTEVLDSRRLVRWLLANPEPDQDAVIELGRRLREYQVPAYVVETDDERVVRDVFERINDSGRRLEAHEVFDGRFRGLDGERPEGLRNVAAAFDELGFGHLPEDQVHNMLLALDPADPTAADTARWSGDQARRALEGLQHGGRRTIAFLAHDAAIPHVDFLPYTLPLQVLTRFFHLHPDPHPRNRQLLARWVWRGAATGRHTGAVLGRRASLSAVDADEDASVQRLLAQVRLDGAPQFDAAADFRFNTARSKLAALALLALGPRDLSTGAALRPDEAHPVPIVGADARIGNRLLHPKRPGLAAALAAVHDERVLRSHLVDLDLRDALTADPARFVRDRTSRAARHVDAFLRERTGWDLPDRGPLASLWRGDE